MTKKIKIIEKSKIIKLFKRGNPIKSKNLFIILLVLLSTGKIDRIFTGWHYKISYYAKLDMV